MQWVAKPAAHCSFLFVTRSRWGKRLFGTSFFTKKRPALASTVVSVEPLAGAELKPVAVSLHLGVGHSRLGAAHAAIRPDNGFHTDNLNLFERHIQPLCQILPGLRDDLLCTR